MQSSPDVFWKAPSAGQPPQSWGTWMSTDCFIPHSDLSTVCLPSPISVLLIPKWPTSLVQPVEAQGAGAHGPRWASPGWPYHAGLCFGETLMTCPSTCTSPEVKACHECCQRHIFLVVYKKLNSAVQARPLVSFLFKSSGSFIVVRRLSGSYSCQ